MLLELPPDLQQQVMERLTTEDVLAVRAVSRGHRDLATKSIHSLTQSSPEHIEEIERCFHNVTSLKLKPETNAHTVHLSLAFQRGFTFPRGLAQLEIDFSEATFDALRCFELDGPVSACPALTDVRVTAYCIDLLGDEDVLERLQVLRAVRRKDPPYPPACFLGSGLMLPSRLPRCSRLRSLTTYTRTDDDTRDLVAGLNGHLCLEQLEVTVPCLGFMADAIKLLDASFPSVHKATLADDRRRGRFSLFPFELAAFPRLEVLAVELTGLRSMSTTLCPRVILGVLGLETVCLANVFDIRPLRFASQMTRLSLVYNEDCNCYPYGDLERVFQTLPQLPNLQYLEVHNGEVPAYHVAQCRALRSAVLEDTIDLMEYSPSEYIAELVSSKSLDTIFVSSESMRHVFPTQKFDFAVGWRGEVCFAEWSGRVCHPEALQDPESYSLGLELTRKPSTQQV